jgi:hypothetical protein
MLMHELVDEVDVSPDDVGTTVRLVSRLRSG